MTVIAAVSINGHVGMAGDRAYNVEDLQVLSKQPKIIQPYPHILIGFAGDGDIGQLAMVQTYPDTRDIRKVTKVLDKCRGEEDNAEWLIGLGSTIYSYTQGVLLEHDYFAIGSGAQVALGVLYVNKDIRMAVMGACHHISTCAGEIDVFWT